MGNPKSEMEDSVENPKAFAEIVTNNKEMLSIFHYTESIARTSEPVLITGETGVGKELIAKTIHSLSARKGRFVVVNVAGLDDNMFSDALFGHTKGAFTGADKARQGMAERASGGTLCLDEIGELSFSSQVKLLRFLQDGEYLPLGRDEPKHTDARVVAVTNVDLWALQKADKFRKDLNFRLRTHHINIPPLRERMDDIPILVDHFLSQATTSMNKKKPTCPAELFPLLQTYSFPGNIRELKALIFDAVSRHKTRIFSLKEFKSHIAREQKDRIVPTEVESEETDLLIFPRKLPTIKQATQLLVDESLKRADGNQSIAAGMLGISHQALSKRLKDKNSEIRSRKPR